MPKPRAVSFLSVYLAVKPVGEPDAGDRHVRFDERGWETGRWPLAPSYRAHPRLYLWDMPSDTENDWVPKTQTRKER